MTLQMIPLFLGNIRGWEWIVILLVILLLFGGKKIPELMKGVGRGITSFRQGLHESKKEIEEEIKKSDKPDEVNGSK
ncbi:MAG: twin-arginine translocase TatA/TatE family subunit [Muribaculaceae bacterium]|nr:twin-arginine translocase TatA/TatE family subunit [Muribaculaceae bacterium]